MKTLVPCRITNYQITYIDIDLSSLFLFFKTSYIFYEELFILDNLFSMTLLKITIIIVV